MFEITTVISFCSYDFRFLAKSIEEVSKFSKEIIVSVADHLFDETKEDLIFLQKIYNHFPEVKFIEFTYDTTSLYLPHLNVQNQEETWKNLWHSTNRFLGFLYSQKQTNYILFLDADEIIEGDKMKSWLENQKVLQNAYWLSAYCYGFSAEKQLKQIQQTALLVQKKAINPSQIFHSQERFGIFCSIEEPKKTHICSIDNTPMIHHYSWVRKKKEIQKKIQAWGKAHLKNWKNWLKTNSLEEDWILIFPFFDPLKVRKNFPHKINNNPLKITATTARKKQIYDLL